VIGEGTAVKGLVAVGRMTFASRERLVLIPGSRSASCGPYVAPMRSARRGSARPIAARSILICSPCRDDYLDGEDVMPKEIPNVFEIMATTRSMRRLKPDPVSAPLIRKILEAGVSAPSGGEIGVPRRQSRNGLGDGRVFGGPIVAPAS
jgi:hypothetical protein